MISESDRNLLEAYLDDELSATEVQRLDSRLSDDAELSHAFDSLKTDRAARIAVFTSLAPTDRDANRFAVTVLGSIQRQQRKTKFARQLRIVAAIAACLIVGFSVGWVGRGRSAAPQVGIAPNMVPTPAVATIHPHGDTHLIVHSPKAPEPGQYQVAVLDADGNVIALQRFAKLEDARQFSEDLNQFELRRQQVQESQAMLVSDSF